MANDTPGSAGTARRSRSRHSDGVITGPLSDRTPALRRDLRELIERPLNLLELSPEAFTAVVDEFTEKAEPLLLAIKRTAAILAWAARHHLPDTHYGAWLHRLAEKVGRSDDTLTRWRDEVTSELGLPVPEVTERRSQARLAAGSLRRSSRQREAPEVIELGEVGASLPVRTALTALLENPNAAAVLADSFSTDELRDLKDLFTDALRLQRREARLARVAAEGEAQRVVAS